MTHLFIINPAAGSHDQSDEYCEAIHRECDNRNIPYRIEISGAPGECRRIAREAAESGEEYRIYACGGDGTLNEIVSATAGFPNVAVSIFAGGSGNDFVKIFNQPSAFTKLDRLLDARVEEFDLIRCNDDISLNICSVGLDARIGTQIAYYKRLPFLSGFRAYVASAAVNVIKGITEHYVIHVNGETIDGLETMVCVCNGRFYGGGFNPVPFADPTDGILDVLLVDKVSRLKAIRVIGKYKNGRFAEFPEHIRHLRTNHLTIEADRPTSVNLDGELRMAKTIDIRIADEKVRFFYPKDLTWQLGTPVRL